MADGYSMHLANTTAIKQYDGLTHTNDHSDARWLAQLFRLGILPTGYIYPKKERKAAELELELDEPQNLTRQPRGNYWDCQHMDILGYQQFSVDNEWPGAGEPVSPSLDPDA